MLQRCAHGPHHQVGDSSSLGFPGGPVVRNPPANERATGSITAPHAAGQLSPCATSLSLFSRVCELKLLKPARLEPVFCNKRNHCKETPVHCN